MLTPDASINDSHLYLGDCFEVMRQLPPASVDMVFADIPYNLTDAKWDAAPFDLACMWECLRRLTKPSAAIVMTGCNPFSAKLIMSNVEAYKHGWLWDKGLATAFLFAKYRPMRYVEDVHVFCQHGRVAYYPIMQDREQPRHRKTSRPVGERKNIECYAGNFVPQEGYSPDAFKKHPHQIIRAGFRGNLANDGIKERGAHPTQKPIDLMVYLIRTYSLPGQVVLDFTMGSGSTGLAAMETGRKFVGIEVDKKHFNTSRWRMEQVKDVYREDAAEAFELRLTEAKVQPQDGLFDTLEGGGSEC